MASQENISALKLLAAFSFRHLLVGYVVTVKENKKRKFILNQGNDLGANIDT